MSEQKLVIDPCPECVVIEWSVKWAATCGVIELNPPDGHTGAKTLPLKLETHWLNRQRWVSDWEQVQCPDGGKCHHNCVNDCWHVKNAGPLSGVFPNDEWPE